MNKYIEMLSALDIKVDEDETLSKEQKEALRMMKNGENVVLIAEAGTGKTHCIKSFVRYTREMGEKTIHVTSTTGISAYNLSDEYTAGITINSYMGYGTGGNTKEELLKKIERNSASRQRILETDILVIDELSMMSADLFEKTDYILKKIKRSSNIFGGIQIVLSMDPYQLCPVFDKNAKDTRLVIESELFKKMLAKKIIQLKKNFRQENDTTGFVEILGRIRTGDFTKEDIEKLNTRKNKTDPEAIHVVVSNRKAKYINDIKLSELPGVMHEYNSVYTSTSNDPSLKRELENQFKQREMDHITLKEGARVMLTKNLDVINGLVNGSLGFIKTFRREFNEICPVIKFDNGMTETITKKTWELKIGGINL